MKALLITGASAGIGLHTADLSAKEGYQVINLSARRCPWTRHPHQLRPLEPGFIEPSAPRLTGPAAAERLC